MIIGIGTHIVECLRIAQMIERHADVFLTRVFTSAEIEYCHSRKASTQHFAAHWAGKEAILKAMGNGWSRGLSWKDVEIRSDNNSSHEVALGGEMRRICEQSGIGRLMITLAHCRTHATAYALALGRDDDQ